MLCVYTTQPGLSISRDFQLQIRKLILIEQEKSTPKNMARKKDTLYIYIPVLFSLFPPNRQKNSETSGFGFSRICRIQIF